MISKVKGILKEESLIKYILSCAIIVGIVCVLEFFVFNYRHWQSIGNDPQPVAYTLSENLAIADVNAFEVMSDEGEKYIEVTGLDTPIHNIMADFTFPLVGVYAVQRIEYHMQIIDEGNRNWYDTPNYTFMHLVPQSMYNYLNSYGNVKSFRIVFDNLNVGDVVRVEFLTLNSKVPMMFSKKRVLTLSIFLILLFLLRPRGILFSIPTTSSKKIKCIAIAIMIVVEAAFSYWAIHLNAYFRDPQSVTERQYMYLTEALAQGETHLLVDPPQGLIELDDPYDYNTRIKACAGQEEPLWDTAYHDGHYYVYFGVAPIIIYYLPYYLMTGNHVHTRNIVFINIILVILGIATLLYEIIRRWYRDIPLSLYIMFTMMFTFGGGIVFLLMKPDFYAVPLSMAVACCIWGMYFWLHSIREDKIMAWEVCIGSLLLALEAATRPQFLLASFLAVIIFWNAIFKERTLFSKKSVGATIAFAIPYVIVAAGVMFYNYDRFGSVFDFGANYNLTFNNMPYRGFHLDRLLHSTVGYLFYPCTVTNMFPYFDRSTYISSYYGITADEPLYGGLIYNNIILLPALFGFRFRKYITDIRKYIYVCIAPVIAILVAFVDGNMAGVLTRYYNDFAWYIYISMFIILCSVVMRHMTNIKSTNDGFLCEEYGPNKTLQTIFTIVWICFIVFIIRLFLDQFGGDAHPQDNLILAWQRTKHLVEFWH